MDVLWSYISPTRISQPASLKGKAARHLTATSLKRVIRIFVAWKLLLLVVTVASPGPGYDTSTRILFDRYRDNTSPHSWTERVVEHVVLRLTRWDALYFATSSERGHLYEQEWAFSWLFSRLTSLIARVLFSALPVSSIVKHALSGILLSHLSHLLAVTTLYTLIHTIAPTAPARKSHLAFTTTCLHVISPAGLFLSAPYAESTFSLFNSLGLLCYALAISNRFERYADAYQVDAFYTLLAGFWFALATMMRSNGFLSALPFVWDALAAAPRLHHVLRNRDVEALTHLITTITAGAIVTLGFALPQALAYREFCMGGAEGVPRPWCTAIPPSVYSFVQAEYWDVGFLRYWTLSNLPLFALALPIGWIMVETSLPSLFQAGHIARVVSGSSEADRPGGKLQQGHPAGIPEATKQEKVFTYLLPRLALPQIVLVGMAATGFHVQIINRISSGYPLWYFIIAVELCVSNGSEGWRRRSQGPRSQGRRSQGRRSEGGLGLGGDGGLGGVEGQGRNASLLRLMGNYDWLPWAKPEWIVRGMVVYAVVQGGLYASFLPPA